MDETTALITTLEATDAAAATACEGWTAHELVAHLAAGATEMAALTEDAVAGRPSRETRDLGDREAPFVVLDDDVLREQLVMAALRLGAAVEALRATGPTAAVRFAGGSLTAADLTMHGRSEAALHRWDLAGDDDISVELLSQPELTTHAISVMSTMPGAALESVSRRAQAVGITEGRSTFASPGQPDVVLLCDAAGARLELAEPSARPTATADPATRLLALWGRRSGRGTIRWNDDGPDAHRLEGLLWATRHGMIG
jgi:hypothetical protein